MGKEKGTRMFGSNKDSHPFPFGDFWYPIQVKQKDKVGRPDIDAFEAMMTREDRKKGFVVSFDYTTDALSEISGFFKLSGRIIIPLTVQEILVLVQFETGRVRF